MRVARDTKGRFGLFAFCSTITARRSCIEDWHLWLCEIHSAMVFSTVATLDCEDPSPILNPLPNLLPDSNSHRTRRKERTSVPAVLCGGISGICFYMSTLPIDRCKTVIMTQDFRQHRPRTLQVFQSLYASQGLVGFYRGSSPTLLRTFCGQAVALTTYDYATQVMVVGS